MWFCSTRKFCRASGRPVSPRLAKWFRPRLVTLEDRIAPANWVSMVTPPDLPPFPPDAAIQPGETTQTPYALIGLWGHNNHDVYAVGNYRTILHYDGNTWSPMSVRGRTSFQDPNLNNITSQAAFIQLTGVWGVDTDGVVDVYAAGFERINPVSGPISGHIYHYRSGDPNWGDTYWHEMTVPNGDVAAGTFGLQGVWGSSNHDVYAMGNLGELLHYDGNTNDAWTPIERPGFQLFRMWGSGMNLVAVGSNPIHRSGDNGQTWQNINPFAIGTALRGVWGTDSGDVFAVGGNGMSLVNGVIARSHDFGATWPSQEIQTIVGTPLARQFLQRVWGRSDQDVLAVGHTGTILHFDGTNWTPQTSGTNENLADVWGSGSATFIVGANRTILYLYSLSNSPPNPTAGGPYTILEGQSLTLDGSASSDPDNDPLTYSWDVNGFISVARGVNPTLTWSQLGTFGITDGPHTPLYQITVHVSDALFATDSAAASLTVNNAPPTATPGNNGPVNEGSPATVYLTNPMDPSSDDTAAGFHYTYALSSAALATTYAGATDGTSKPFTFSDNGSYTVYGRIFDKDGGFSDYATVVTVNNVAPIASMTYNGVDAEGSPDTVNFARTFDPSSDDTTAGFHCSFALISAALATNYAGATDGTGKSFTFSDNGEYTIYGRIFDKDGGYTDQQTVVIVYNVAPTATMSNNGPIDEGSPVAVSFSGASDPSSADTAAGFYYSFALSRAALANTPAGATDGTSKPFTFFRYGSYTVYGRIFDKDGGYTQYETTVHVNNVPPANVSLSLSAGSISEGGTTTLSGSFTDPGTLERHIVVFDWGDGSPNSFRDLAAGMLTFSGVSHQYPDNPSGQPNGSFPITATVGDGVGLGSGSTWVQVKNVAPVIALAGPSNGVPGQPRTFTFSALDPSPTDQAAGFTYTVTWGDGTSLTIPKTAGSGVAVDHVYTATGSYTPILTLTDKDGGTSAGVQAVTVTAAALEVDLGDSSKMALAVAGTTADDTITLSPVDAVGSITVKITTGNKSTTYGPFQPTGHILVYGQAGDDTIVFDNPFTSRGTKYYVSVPAVLYGGEGADTINAKNSTANNVLFGDAGNDILTGNDSSQGGQGRDLLIGGIGKDVLDASIAGDSILIGGSTDYDLSNPLTTYDKKLADLYAIMAEWGRTDLPGTTQQQYTARVGHLLGPNAGGTAGGLNGSYFLNATTVHDDLVKDTLTGSTVAFDWFFADAGGQDILQNRRTGGVTGEITTLYT